MTREDREPTEKWATDKGVEYGFAYDTSGLSAELGISGIPHAVLVDPFGDIVWRGRPAELSSEILEGALGLAIPSPMWTWPASAGALREAIAEENLGRALELAGSLDLPQLEGVQELLSVRVDRAVARVEALVAEDDALGASEAAGDLQAQLGGGGLEQGDRVAKLAERLSTEPRLLAIAKDQQELRQAEALWPENSAQLKALDRALVAESLERAQAISARYESGAPARQAQAAVERLEKLLDLVK